MKGTIRIGVGLIVALAAAGAWGCDDDSTGPVEESGLNFTYDGDRSGSHTSDGVTPTIGSGGLPEVGSWAIARPDSLGGLVITAFDPTDETTGDLFILQLHPLGTGEFSDCGVVGNSDCHGRLIIGVDTDDLSAVEAWFEISEGTVTITEASATRIVGTFSVTFTNQDGSETITVTDGMIDVPYSSDAQLGSGLACLARNLRDGTNEPC